MNIVSSYAYLNMDQMNHKEPEALMWVDESLAFSIISGFWRGFKPRKVWLFPTHALSKARLLVAFITCFTRGKARFQDWLKAIPGGT